MMFGFESGDQSNISIEGKYQGQEIIVVVYFEPAMDDEADDRDSSADI